MTCGKTRQKRNGPGGSGCFHAFCYFLGRPARGLCEAGAGRRGLGARFLAKPCSSVPLAPSPGAFSGTGRRAGRGASLPAIPCSFVDGHHVFRTGEARCEPDVVLHSPQNLALSSTGTTSLEPKAPPASRTWCLTPRNPLFFRRRAPRLWSRPTPGRPAWCLTPRKTLFFRRRAPRFPNRRGPMRAGRGASLPAKPCSFVDGHHVSRTGEARCEPDVVLPSPQNLALSSTGTTSLEPDRSPAGRTWCLPPRNPLFFRRRAPRLWSQRRRRRARRGASLPAKPCSFVDGHHVFRTGEARCEPDVVPPSPQSLALSSTGTTFSEPERPDASRTWCLPPRKTLLFRRRAPRL